MSRAATAKNRVAESTKRYQIIRLDADTQWGRKADQSVSADLTWQEALQRLEGSDMDIDFTLASLAHHKSAQFHNAAGELCELRVHVR